MTQSGPGPPAQDVSQDSTKETRLRSYAFSSRIFARTAVMAMVIMFGLASSTALNMVVVPILHERFGRPATLAKSAS